MEFRKSYLLSDNVEEACEATWQYTTAHARYWRLLTHSNNMQYLLLFHGHSGYTNAPVITYIACLGCFAVSFSRCETHRASWSPKQPHWRCVFTCVLHNEASNTSAWYVPIIQVATCIKCSMVTCGTPESRIRLVRAFDLSYLLFFLSIPYTKTGEISMNWLTVFCELMESRCIAFLCISLHLVVLFKRMLNC